MPYAFAENAAPAPVHVQKLSDGPHFPAKESGPVVVWSEHLETPRQNVLHFLKIDLTDPRIEAFVQLSDDPDGPTGPAEGVLTMPEDLFRKSDTLALMNANAFAGIPSIPSPPGKSGWFLGRQVNLVGFAASDGVIRSPNDPERSAFWLDDAGKPHVGIPGPNDHVRHGVSDYFTILVRDGRNVADVDEKKAAALLDAEDKKSSKISLALHPRSLLGFDDSNRWLLLVVVDGRQPKYSLGMSLHEEAELMLAKGCTQAINVDGGGSSILLVRGDDGKIVTVNRPSSKQHRPVPIMIGVRAASPRR